MLCFELGTLPCRRKRGASQAGNQSGGSVSRNASCVSEPSRGTGAALHATHMTARSSGAL